MKSILIIFCFCSLALCELPPPYSYRSFRPSPQYQPFNNPSTSYLPASQSLNVKVPSKLTIEQLISLTEKLQSRPQKIQVNLPQQNYGPPSKFQSNQLRPPALGAPQSLYGIPNKLQSNQQTLSNVYGPPNKLQSSQPQKLYSPANNNNVQLTQAQQSIPQTSHVTPLQIPPATNYGVPDIRSIETLGEQQNSAGFSKQQQLPYPSSSPQFNPQNNAPNQQYLPPQTTPRSAFTTKATTIRPQTVATTPTTDGDYDYDQPNEGGSEAGPNVSISNAVAGGGNVFYLQQPDGRLQRVVLQKTQEPNSKPDEYIANYYFQNIEPLPNAVYAPLITLGGIAQK